MSYFCSTFTMSTERKTSKTLVMSNTITKIKKAAKNNTWSNVNTIIENSGLELKLVQNFPYGKMWQVINDKDLAWVSNFKKYIDQEIPEIKYSLNY